MPTNARPIDSPRARWVEIAVSVAFSITTSAVVVAWTVSATLAKFETKLDGQDVRIGAVELSSRQVLDENSVQTSRIAVQESQWTEVIRRLDAIDRKLEAR